MKIYCCYSEAHRLLFERHFAPTLPASFELKAYRLEVAGKGDFFATDFLECIRRKVVLIRNSIDANRGEAIVWADVDIRFYADPVPDMRAQVENEPETVCWFQRESKKIPDVNTGFVMIRCNEKARRFFEQVADELKVRIDCNEQTVINQLLQAGSFPQWSYLSWKYYARTHGWPPPHDLLLYHANYTVGANSVQRKEEQFRELAWIRRYGSPARLWSCLRRVPGKVMRLARK